MNNLVTQSAEKFEEYVNTNGPLIGFDLGTKTIVITAEKTHFMNEIRLKEKPFTKH